MSRGSNNAPPLQKKKKKKKRLACPRFCGINIQSTLVISKLKGPSETIRDIRTSTDFRIEENTNRTTKLRK